MHIHRTIAAAGLLALALLVLQAPPASADPSGPSDYRSEVTAIAPSVEGVDARIRGGDAFLELEVARGHTVVVAGYEGEPYLQFLEDGTVQRNRLSSATYLNEDRSGEVTIPAEVQGAMSSGSADPDWMTIGDDGTYAWHDHRVHWMDAAPPRDLERGQPVGGRYDPWVVPIQVDGTEAEIQGTLTYESSTTALPWFGVALLAAVALVWLTRARGLPVASAALAVVASVGVIVGRADWDSTPGGGNPLLWLLPLGAALAAAGGVALGRRGVAVALSLAGVACLSGWALLRIQVLLKPVLPTELSPTLDRATVALALAASIAAAWNAVAAAGLALPDLADDEPPPSPT